ncbi:MAG: hypothetical protein M9894_10450 [Planctomycetes bacterium]|nr:hypothetical protein [Planctomycetota bacterium]
MAETVRSVATTNSPKTWFGPVKAVTTKAPGGRSVVVVPAPSWTLPIRCRADAGGSVRGPPTTVTAASCPGSNPMRAACPPVAVAVSAPVALTVRSPATVKVPYAVVGCVPWVASRNVPGGR